MKGIARTLRSPVKGLLVFLAAFLLPGGLFGHGVEVYDISGPAGPPVIHFKYSTGEGMAYAQVRLYAPSRPETEVLLSLTDRNGRFSFVPDEEGVWTVEASDGMGHQGSITITGTAETAAAGAAMGTAPAAAGGKTPLFLRIILGLSLMLNIFGLYYLVLRGISKKRGAHAYQ
jgi:nickel transport protein